MSQLLSGFLTRNFLALVLLTLSLSSVGEPLQPSNILFNNVRVFDGKDERLSKPTNVLVRNGLIAAIGRTEFDPENEALRIDAAGRTLMPGMIDVHSHLAITTSLSEMNGVVSVEENAIRSAVIARQFLLDGFTTVRDLGGNVFGLKRAIDTGLVPGPRIYLNASAGVALDKLLDAEARGVPALLLVVPAGEDAGDPEHTVYGL